MSKRVGVSRWRAENRALREQFESKAERLDRETVQKIAKDPEHVVDHVRSLLAMLRCDLTVRKWRELSE